MAEGAAQIPVRPGSELANFGFRRPALVADQNILAGIMMPCRRVAIDVLMSADPAIAAQIIHYCFRSMNEAEVSDPELCSYFASLMLAFVPGLRADFVNALYLTGLEVTILDGSAAHPYEGADFNETFTYGTSLILFGQGVLLLFKNITQQNYERYMTSRITALSALAGASPDQGVAFLVPLVRAEKIRSIMGAKQELRIQLVRFMVSASRQKTPFGAVCGYICNLLAFHDMSAIQIIMNALLIPKSPVITDIRVSAEIRNLSQALVAIARSDSPQFFRIIETPAVTKVVERSNFPVLIAVAQIVQLDQTPSLGNFMTSTAPDNPVVADLVSIHRQYLLNTQRNNLPYIARYITSFDNPNLVTDGFNREN